MITNPLLAAHEQAKIAEGVAGRAAREAKQAHNMAIEALHQTRYALILSIPCPFCPAQVNEPCWEHNRLHPDTGEPIITLGLLAQHGGRQDLSGARGEYSYELALARQESGS